MFAKDIKNFQTEIYSFNYTIFYYYHHYYYFGLHILLKIFVFITLWLFVEEAAIFVQFNCSFFLSSPNFIIPLPTEQVNLWRFESSACVCVCVCALLFDEPKKKLKNGTYNNIPCYTHTFGIFCIVFFLFRLFFINPLMYVRWYAERAKTSIVVAVGVASFVCMCCWRDAMRNDRVLFTRQSRAGEMRFIF